MNINPAVFTVPQLREQVAALDPTRPTSKLRKAELITLLQELTAQRTADEAMQLANDDRLAEQVFASEREADAVAGLVADLADMTAHWAEDLPGQVAEPGAFADEVVAADMEEERVAAEAVDGVIDEELGDVAQTLTDLAHAITPAMRTSAKALAVVAWGHLQATVHSMGREVHGKVVDTVLRGAGPDGMGRVCVVVQHTERANTDWLGNVTWEPTPTYRRTLHRYVDVKFSPLAS
jgi:hypothetical protein